jgi:hypothetical protein
MSSLETAIQRVDKLKKMAESIIGTSGQNAQLIENKLKLIQNRISKLADLRQSLKTRFGLLSAQTADIQRLVSQTQGLEELEAKLQLLQTQISGVNNLDLSDLDKTIDELQQLMNVPGNSGDGSGNSSAARADIVAPSSVVQQPTRAVSRMRPRPVYPPGAPAPGQTGGYRYDSVSISRSKTIKKRRSSPSTSKSRSISKTRRSRPVHRKRK